MIILFLINTSCFAQDSIPFFSHYLIDKEITCCRRVKNQLHCLDSLIQVNLKMPGHSDKNYQKVYLDRFRKLFLYYVNAGFVSGYRGDIVQSFIYFDLSEQCLDTLKKKGKTDEFEDFQNIIRHQKTEFCAKTYFKDTILFNQCYCAQFFPENKDESVIDTVISPHKKQVPPVKYPNWGELYTHDTLRINKHFVSNSASIIYFKTLQPLLLTKLLQNPYYFEMIGDPSLHIIRDTIIYKLSANYKKGKYERTCELVFTSSKHPEKFDNLLLLLSNLEFPGFIKDLEIYIPIVVTTENSTQTNNAGIYDDHFLIEAIKLKPIKLNSK